MSVWKVVVDGSCLGVFTSMEDARRAATALQQKNSWSKVEVIEKMRANDRVVMRRTATVQRPKPSPLPKRKVQFKEATGRLTVPSGTLVVVFRNLNIVSPEKKMKAKGWVKSKLKQERTFFECHQVTSMNNGMLETDTIKLLTGRGWMVFHTEDPNYPLIAFSAFTKDFPMKAANLGMRCENGMLPEHALPFHTPLKYPPQGSTFERLFNEQKNAFLFKEGFNAGAKLAEKKAEKQLDSDES